MLINVKYGETIEKSSSKGTMHFGQMPREEDKVEIDGAICTVLASWHTPHHVYAGTKATVLIYAKTPALIDERLKVKDLAHA